MAKEKEIDNKVEVFIPRDPASKESNIYVGVNGIGYLIPRGKKSLVPDFIAAELERSRAAEEAMYEAQDEMKSKAKE